MSSTAPLHRIFSFGTLLDPAVQRHVFGREIPVATDRLLGHRFVEVPIDDPAVVAASGLAVHRGLARADGGSVPGGVLTVDDAELSAADAYEVAAYSRRRVSTVGHGTVWAYVDANPLDAAERIGVVGDSIAYGRCDAPYGWAQLLGASHVAPDEARRRFFNLAIPGATAADLARFATRETADRRCDTVLIACGINDLLHGTGTVAETAAHIQNIAEGVEAHGARAVVVGPAWVDVGHAEPAFGRSVDDAVVRELDAMLTAWGTRTHRDVVSVHSVLAGHPGLLSDGVHPSREGHALLADRIRRARHVP